MNDKDCCNWICPVMDLLSSISKKWILLVIKSIAEGANSYSDIEKNLPFINPSSLSARLKELQELWFIEKKVISDTPVKIEYQLSKKWKSFSLLLDDIVDWAQEWN